MSPRTRKKPLDADSASRAPVNRASPPREESYQLLIHCADELTQEELFEEMTHRGYRVRVLTMN